MFRDEETLIASFELMDGHDRVVPGQVKGQRLSRHRQRLHGLCEDAWGCGTVHDDQ